MLKIWKTYILIGLLFYTGDLFAQKRYRLEWNTFQQLDSIMQTDPTLDGKKILLYFHTDWCVYCRKMEQAVFTNENIKKTLRSDYIFVKMDAETDEEIYFDGIKYNKEEGEKYHFLANALASREGQLVFPTFLILNKDFQLLKSHYQYMSIKQFQKFLQF